MRISDDRYSRDRLRLDLALRFIHHEARTHTIRAWTGLTDDRIRKLYRTYLHEADGAGVARHRGKSPRQAAFFTRSLRMRREAAVFASVSSLFGLITPQAITGRPRPRSPRPRWRAARCCARRSRPTARWSANRRSPSSTRCTCSARCWPATNCASRIAAIAPACWSPTGWRCARRSATNARGEARQPTDASDDLRAGLRRATAHRAVR